MSDFEDTGDVGATEAESTDTGVADSEAGAAGPEGAGESEGGGLSQGAGQAPQQSASAAPARQAPTGLSREQFEAAMRQRDTYWQSQLRAHQAELARIRRMQSRPAQQPQAPAQGPLPTLQEWIQKGYSPESWELLNGMNTHYEQKYKDFEARYNGLRGELQGQQRKAQQREIETALDSGWNEAIADVYSKEYKHLSGNAELDGLLKQVLFVESFQAIQAKRDPRFLDNRSVLRKVLSTVDKLVKAGIAKQVRTAPAPTPPAPKGAPTKPGVQKTKAKSEKEFFDSIAARARAALE